MTVGEKIQFYRKNMGLSQEELGQKMLVSRQTVSLWEMDKTLPTVDNLIRLKEIFSVSIDDILSSTEPTEKIVEQPKETYVFKYESADINIIFKKTRFQLIIRAVVFAIACGILLAAASAANANDIIIGLIWGCFILGAISHIKGFLIYKQTQKDSAARALESTYSYEIFDGYFKVNISRNGEITKNLKIYFNEVERTQSLGTYLVLQIAGQSYIIKKDALISNSAFLTLNKPEQEKPAVKKPGKLVKTVSILLFIFSIATIWGALLGVAILTAANQMMTENMWVFFLFLPIPIASIVFGFCMKKKGYRCKKNIIVGFIMAAFLCIYGSFTFIFSNVYSHSEEPILKTESLLNIDIPTHSRINTQDWTRGTQSVPRGYIYSTSDIYFEDAAVEDFEKKLSGDSRWMSEIPNDMIGITSYFCDIQPSDYYIIYNKDTNEINKLPSDSGTYVFINVLYDLDSNTMKLVEYRIEYTK